MRAQGYSGRSQRDYRMLDRIAGKRAGKHQNSCTISETISFALPHFYIIHEVFKKSNCSLSSSNTSNTIGQVKVRPIMPIVLKEKSGP
jgi:hypothetical protein